jgi:hypothetical protein
MLENGVEHGAPGTKIGTTVKNAYITKNNTIQICASWKMVELTLKKYWDKPMRKRENAMCTKQ